MFYLTDSIGLNMGMIGTLMAISKVFDGVSDFFFGRMIDKTHTKMGKARPWMLWAYIGCAITLVLTFSVPTSWGETAQYIYFFITYTLLNAVFFTANNIAYASLTALITKNTNERVQLGSYRFIFAFATSLIIQYITIKAVGWCGGGTMGWRTVTIIMACVGLIVNTVSCLSVKELKETDDVEEESVEKLTLRESLRLLLSNKYYLLICGIYILTQIYTSMIGMGVYYAKYILGNEDLFSTFSLFINIPLVTGLILSPILIARLKGMYKINIAGYIIATLFRGMVIVAAYAGSLPLMLIFTALAAFGISPLQGDMNALIAAASEYTTLKTGKCIDGMMFSCSSLGIKVGSAIGTAICGWLLEATGYVENALTQTAATVSMMNILYLWMPMIICGLVTLLLTRLKIEKANKNLREEKNNMETLS